ncbi:MAG: 5-dehydro-2-deoxygluconokinase [Pseudomonadota bacterium]
MSDKIFDAVFIGRAGVDLYGDQIGGRLEDMGSFSKYIGGSPTNTSIGAARLGTKAAVISRVGDDAMGRFIREELVREGVNTDALRTDPDRLTALVLLGIRDKEQFPLIFYRENCADMGLAPDDIPEDLIARAGAVVTSGTHFSTATTKAASLRALELAKIHGAGRWIDLDYRPVLWGLADKGDGETRFIADDGVTEHLQGIMHHLDVVVGTEEEIHIAGGSTDTIACLKTLRALTDATFVVKLGAEGCAVFEGMVPDRIADGLVVPGFPVEVFNVLGAGDAFMGGLVTGRIENRNWYEAARMANACGAFAVSRHACAPAYPSRVELDRFMIEGSPHHRLREDAVLNRLHWGTTRQVDWPEVLAFAFDHRAQLEVMSDDPVRISSFKELCAEVLIEARIRHPDRRLGALCDRRYGGDALAAMEGRGLWLATPVEWPGSRPLRFEGGANIADFLREVPRTQVVKCLCFTHPDDPEDLVAAQRDTLRRLCAAARGWRLELLLELIPPVDTRVAPDTIARSMAAFYKAGITPDWWKLGPPAADQWEDTWAAWRAVIDAHDPNCRGVLLLGLAAPLDEVVETVAKSRAQTLCKGFAVGRSIFGAAAAGWFAGTADDTEAKALMATAYDRLIAAWG